MVIDQAHDPGLGVLLAAEADEKGTFDVNVPEFIGSSSLIAGSGPSRHAATSTPGGLEETVDVGVADLVDLPPSQFSRDPLRVPVGELNCPGFAGDSIPWK